MSFEFAPLQPINHAGRLGATVLRPIGAAINVWGQASQLGSQRNVTRSIVSTYRQKFEEQSTACDLGPKANQVTDLPVEEQPRALKQAVLQERLKGKLDGYLDRLDTIDANPLRMNVLLFQELADEVLDHAEVITAPLELEAPAPRRALEAPSTPNGHIAL